MLRGLRFRVLGSPFSCLGVFVFVFWGIRLLVLGSSFRVLGSPFLCLGVFVFVFWGLRFRV